VVILEAVFTANHLTDTDKQNTVQENKLNKYNKEKENKNSAKQNSRLFTTLGQETRWTYSATLPSPDGSS